MNLLALAQNQGTSISKALCSYSACLGCPGRNHGRPRHPLSAHAPLKADSLHYFTNSEMLTFVIKCRTINSFLRFL